MGLSNEEIREAVALENTSVLCKASEYRELVYQVKQNISEDAFEDFFINLPAVDATESGNIQENIAEEEPIKQVATERQLDTQQLDCQSEIEVAPMIVNLSSAINVEQNHLQGPAFVRAQTEQIRVSEFGVAAIESAAKALQNQEHKVTAQLQECTLKTNRQTVEKQMQSAKAVQQNQPAVAAVEELGQQYRKRIQNLKYEVANFKPEPKIQQARQKVLEKYAPILQEAEKVKQVCKINSEAKSEADQVRLEDDPVARQNQEYSAVQTTKIVPKLPGLGQPERQTGILGYVMGGFSIVLGGVLAFCTKGNVAKFGFVAIQKGMELITTNWKDNSEGTYDRRKLVKIALEGLLPAAVDNLGPSLLGVLNKQMAALHMSPEKIAQYSDITQNALDSIKIAALASRAVGLESAAKDSVRAQGAQKEELPEEEFARMFWTEYDTKIKSRLDKIEPEAIEGLMRKIKTQLADQEALRLLALKSAELQVNPVMFGFLAEANPTALKALSSKAVKGLIDNSVQVLTVVRREQSYLLGLIPEEDLFSSEGLQVDKNILVTVEYAVNWIGPLVAKLKSKGQLKGITKYTKDLLKSEKEIIDAMKGKPGFNDHSTAYKSLETFLNSKELSDNYLTLVDSLGANYLKQKQLASVQQVIDHLDPKGKCPKVHMQTVAGLLLESFKSTVQSWDSFEEELSGQLSTYLAYFMANQKIQQAKKKNPNLGKL